MIPNRSSVKLKSPSTRIRRQIFAFAALFSLINLICSTQISVFGNNGVESQELYPFGSSQEEPGYLWVNKTVNWYAASMNQSQSFEICIQGPSYPYGVEPGACQTIGYTGGGMYWDSLIPGDYFVRETNPGSVWAVTLPPNPISVISEEWSTTQVVNNYNRGLLMVTKFVDWKGVPIDYGKTFRICIQGPSYSNWDQPGACQSTDGPTTDSLLWENLIPGGYMVGEYNPGSEWEVTVPPGPISVSGGEWVNTSISNTHILPGFQLLTPNGNEVLAAGQPWVIRWNTIGSLNSVRLEYSTDDFTIYGIIIVNITSNSGYYLWTLPSEPTFNLRVRVSDPGGVGQSDTSDQPFRSIIMNERIYLTEISR